jgi:hypothetical protein
MLWELILILSLFVGTIALLFSVLSLYRTSVLKTEQTKWITEIKIRMTKLISDINRVNEIEYNTDMQLSNALNAR